MTDATKIDAGLKAVIEAVGGIEALAQRLRVKPYAVAQWHRVPIERLMQIERLTGISRVYLRPDLHEPKHLNDNDREEFYKFATAMLVVEPRCVDPANGAQTTEERIKKLLKAFLELRLEQSE